MNYEFNFVPLRPKLNYELPRHYTRTGNFPLHRHLSSSRHQERIPLWREVLASVSHHGISRLHRVAVRREYIHLGAAWRLQFLVFLVDTGALPTTGEGSERLVPEEEGRERGLRDDDLNDDLNLNLNLLGCSSTTPPAPEHQQERKKARMQSRKNVDDFCAFFGKCFRNRRKTLGRSSSQQLRRYSRSPFARIYSNKFGISLAYSYLCSAI